MATLNNARRLVVKVGSALLVDRTTDTLRRDWLEGLAEDVAAVRAANADVVLVSSGSIALGRRVLGLPEGALTLEQSQAAAAVGQIRLARAYEEALAPHDIITGQVLVTLEDSTDRRRYLNSRATLLHLLRLGVVPIVNENDTVATDEIRYGDNDRLAAQVAATVGADRLVLLSDVDGLYTGDPRSDPAARRFDVVERITPEIEAGCAMAITAGVGRRPLTALRDGAPATWFLAETDPQAARKRWIAAMKPRGVLTIDAGAQVALEAGRSLLPAGVTEVAGSFGRGDPVAIHGPAEARVIRGLRSGDIAAALGYPGRAALIHRDDMVL